MQHSVTLHEGTALNILAAHTHIGTFHEHRAKGQKLAHTPVDLSVFAHLNALFAQFLELLVNRETLGNFAECFCDVLEGIARDCGVAAMNNFGALLRSRQLKPSDVGGLGSGYGRLGLAKDRVQLRVVCAQCLIRFFLGDIPATHQSLCILGAG